MTTGTGIHPTAVIAPDAVIGEGVEIGPYSIVGSGVTIGNGTWIGSHVVIEGKTDIGQQCKIFHHSYVGGPPQDLKYCGEETRLTVGNHNIIREYVTLNRGTVSGGGITAIGNNNLFMAYVHVAHDCHIGNHVVMANAATLAGHVTIEDRAIIGGLSAIHQFARIGTCVMIGGCSAVPQDVPPYMNATGNRAQLYGLNTIGLQRNNFSDETIGSLKKAYKILFRSKMTLESALDKVQGELGGTPEVDYLVQFIRKSERGICR
ncbi:MAG: acyl-ACP--UDP-N-acetylglucosamine O-acyltransferase [Nitrospirota bacterium]|nr:acyl-ACP--UDP-N-acetylglucosamine O-acyltransferase [Nitrospirota bacterium]